MSYARMMNRPMRARIKAYRASGRMFGQTFNTGISCAPLSEYLQAWRLLDLWVRDRHTYPDKQRTRECIRQQIQEVRRLQALEAKP